jgi:di/tricarboxylate transporter
MQLISSPLFPALLTLGVTAVMFALFVTEAFPPEVTGMAAAGVLVLAGVLPTDDALAVFSNPAPWTIAAMTILSGGLVRTGALTYVSRLITRHGGRRPWLSLGLLGVLIVFASAFMNNTPVVVVGIPIALHLAQTIGYAPSKVMIPLSYLAIVGGLCSLIGTSTNLLVDGVARQAGLAPFTLFEITPLGVCLAAVALVYLRLAIPYLLPHRDSMADLLGTRKRMKYFTEVMVPAGSPLVGARLLDVPLFKHEGMRVVDLLRGDESLRRDLPKATLAEGDRVVLRTEMQELLGLKDSRAVTLVERVGSRRTTTVEALIMPGCRLVGRSLGSLRLRRRYGVYPLAVHRRNQNVGRQLDEVVVRVGDTLLLEGAPEDIRRLAQEVELVDITTPAERPYKRERAPLMVLVLAAVVGLAAMEVMPIEILALAGVIFVLVTGILDADEAFSFVDGRLMALIFAMLALGVAFDRSGAVRLIVDAVAPHLSGRSPVVALVSVYILTVILTELLSNNAVGVLMTPLALGLAQGLGLDPRPFVVAVMVGSSAGFTTPIGYQTNMLVYGPGGYRFGDYFRIGVPMNLIYGTAACLLIPYFWPLGPA